MRRRAVLASIATLPAVSGCLGSPGDGSGAADGDGDDAAGGSDRSGGTDDGPHAALDALEGQPYLGREPGTASRLIVAFEDPGCPNCASFHANELPGVRSEVVEPGDASLVWRPLRYATQVAPWNTEGIHAVLETTSRDVDAAWTLLDHYYANQGEISSSNVAEQTRTALEGTGVDADAVVTALEDGAHTERLSDSEDAASAAGVTSTPTFLLFEDDSFVTRIAGARSAAEFAAAFEA